MKNPLSSKTLSILRLLRIPQWIKNFFVFVPAVFSKNIFQEEYFSAVLGAFVIFSLASSFVYVVNDIADYEKDRLHPKKKYRPVASGSVSAAEAVSIAAALILIDSALIYFFNLSSGFIYAVTGYVIINILYSFTLKNVVIVDIFCIASGFMLRIISGALVIDVMLSSWLILTTLFISLFLAVMKRRAELESAGRTDEQRIVLKEYSLSFVDQIAAISGGGVIISYALYSVAERTIAAFGSEALMFTTIFVIFGVFRYMYVVYKKGHGENVAEVFLSDPPFLINTILYIITALIIIYFH